MDTAGEIKRLIADGETISAIARRLGLSRVHVRRLARRPDDWQPQPRGPAPYPVCIRGVVYPSAVAAGAALGVSAGSVRTLVEQGRADQIGLGRGKASPPNHRKPLRIGPHQFASIADAARKLSVGSETRVRKMIRRGDFEPLISAAMKLEAVQ